MTDIQVRPGRYIVAVSGGIDSMVLLDMLAHTPGLKLIVAHFEHGIRNDSDQDRQLVAAATARYGLPFIYERGNLGAGASEAMARKARYTFLRRARQHLEADAIITAHHQDDLVETAIINLLRGTGRRGLSSLQSTDEIMRPLLSRTKRDLYNYAKQHPAIVWRDDSTNDSDQYLRNYVRHHILRPMSRSSSQALLKYIQGAAAVNPVIDMLLEQAVEQHSKDGLLGRRWFTMLPYDVSCEVMATWLRRSGIRDFDRRTIDRLVVTVKVAIPGKMLDINAGHLLEVGKYGVRIRPR